MTSSRTKKAMNSSAKIRVFVSSVQDELINERIAILELINTDSFLSRHVEAVLFEHQPARTLPAEDAYLSDLESCDVYVGVLGFQYGEAGEDGVSSTHREYLKARELGLPILVFIRGQSGQDKKREPEVMKLFQRIRDSKKGHTYRRFDHYQDLKEKVRKVLLPMLRQNGLSPSESEQMEFEGTLEAASDFDTQPLGQSEHEDLDTELTSQYASAVLDTKKSVDEARVKKVLLQRGMIWFDSNHNTYRPTAAGLLMFGRSPDAAFPQCRIAANAYSGTSKEDLIDRSDIRKPLPSAIEDAIQFLIRNMRHITKTQGFSRVVIDEYPYDALREAVVNAVAHRDYGIRGASIRIEKYSDRLQILSPGGPPPPVTMRKLRSLNYSPCSRNPILARALSYFERIEEQGDGIRRIVDEVTNVGLPGVEFKIVDGHFGVIFAGPGKTLSKLRPLEPRVAYEISRADVGRLNVSQKKIVRGLLGKGRVDSTALAQSLKVTPQAVRKDLAVLQKMGIIEKRGRARATYYVLRGDKHAP
jgi:ATP-dependent DNA helicase RecG